MWEEVKGWGGGGREKKEEEEGEERERLGERDQRGKGQAGIKKGEGRG